MILQVFIFALANSQFCHSFLAFEVILNINGRKNKPIKCTKQFISPIKIIPANVLTCYQCSMFQVNESWFFCLKSYSNTYTYIYIYINIYRNIYIIYIYKYIYICINIYIYYIVLTNTCVNKDGFMCVSKLLNAHL